MKNKKGAVIEAAVIYILFVFALCSLLLAVSLSMSSQRRIFEKRAEYELELERLGDGFISGESGLDSEIYTVSVSEDRSVMQVSARDGSVLLVVRLDENGNVTEWTTRR